MSSKKSVLSEVDGASPGKIFIGGLAKDATLDQFTMYFGKYGEIIDSVIMKDRHTGRPRGFGFITYADPSVVDIVIQENHVINGKQVEIKRTIPKGAAQANDFKTKKIFVGGIPTTLTDEEFKDFFSKYGKVVEHEIIRDHASKRSRGFGFIVFDSDKIVDDVLAGGNMIDMNGNRSNSKDASATLSPPISDPEENALKIKEWEVGRLQEEVAASQGIRIRRRPPTGPPLHYVGPFEFRIQNEGNTPRNILEEIIWHKDVEVSQLKERRPLHVLKKDLDNTPPTRDFVGALRASYEKTRLPGLIAEVKKASPSRGVLREGFDAVEIARAYEKGGAACLSVLTDEKYFQGSFENLEAIRNAGIRCPLLCKEFVIDAWQIYYARVKGADAVLLIAGVLPDLDIGYMIKICKILGLATLVEVHDEREMDRVLGIEGIELIGINNRDLETFNVDISNTRKLLEGRRGQLIREKEIIVVGESGLFTPADIAFVQEAGVKAVLVGESLIKQSDPGKGIANLFGKDISQ